MKLLLPPDQYVVIPMKLAREVGLEMAALLLTLVSLIERCGVRKDGAQQIALDKKQLETVFPWHGSATTRKELEKLRDRGLIFISDETLLTTDTTRWYAINYAKVRTLKSATVLTEDEIETSAPLPVPEVKQEKAQSNGSRMHQHLFGAFMKACNFNRTLMTPRDQGEIGLAVKKLIAADRQMYPDRETADLVAAVEAFPRWWIDVEGKKYRTERTAPRPYTIISNWTRYIDYCRKNLGGQLPQ